MSDKSPRKAAWRLVGAVFVVAVMVNYAWEMAQAALYNPMGSLARGLWRCFAASLGDGVLVVVIMVIGWLTFRRLNWFASPERTGYLLLLISGLAVGLTVEWIGLGSGRWAYGRMPLIPGLGVGVVPVVQMVVLPPVILRLAALWLARQEVL